MSHNTVGHENPRIMSFYQDARKLLRGEIVIPRMISCWLTHVCNLSCSYCLYAASHNKQATVVDPDKFKKFIDEVSSLGVESLEFSGGGEPTLHKECYNLALYAKSKGLQVGLLTNGARIDIPKALKAFRYIRVGVDACNGLLYTQVKRARSEVFDRVSRHIKALVKARRGSIPRIGIKHLITRDNAPYLWEMAQWAKAQGADYVHFKAAHGSPDSLLPVDREEYQMTFNFLKLSEEGFVKGDLGFLQGKYQCFMSPIHAVMDAKGNVLQCCYFNQPKDYLGNAFEDGFGYLWHTLQHVEIRRKRSLTECNKHDCRFHSYNCYWGNILNHETMDVSFI